MSGICANAAGRLLLFYGKKGKRENLLIYQAVRGRGCYKNQCDFEHPYAWMGVSIVRMLEKPEYMGDTINFRSHKEFYKDKRAVRNNSSRKLNDKKCNSGCIQEDTVKQILLETIRYACDSVRMGEEAFMDAIRSASVDREMGEVKKLKKRLLRYIFRNGKHKRSCKFIGERS